MFQRCTHYYLLVGATKIECKEYSLIDFKGCQNMKLCRYYNIILYFFAFLILLKRLF